MVNHVGAHIKQEITDTIINLNLRTHGACELVGFREKNIILHFILNKTHITSMVTYELGNFENRFFSYMYIVKNTFHSVHMVSSV